MSEKKRRHRHYRMGGGWVAPMLPLNEAQFSGGVQDGQDPDPGPVDSPGDAGDAGVGVSA